MYTESATSKQTNYAQTLMAKAGLDGFDAGKLIGLSHINKAFRSKTETSKLIDALKAEINRQKEHTS